MFYKIKKNKIKFNKLTWLEDREKRIYMITDIIKRNLVIGLTKEETLELLGCEFNDKHSNKWYYYIGSKKIIFPIKYFLYIYFDELGKASKIVKK